jgi:2-keto-4-pentenoate hydratase
MTGAQVYLRRERSPVGERHLSAAEVPATLDLAYGAMADFTRADPDQWGGWKLGGSNHASRAAFGVDRLYYGALARSEILTSPALAPGFALHELKGEVEIALRISADGTGYDAWCIALEMPSSPLQGLPGLGVAALVADRCAAGALLLGPIRHGRLPDLAAAQLVQRVNGTVLCEARPAENLTAPPESLLAEFIALARAHAAPVAAGHWVATGGVTVCLPYAPGDRVEVALDGDCQLSFLVTTT